MRYNKGDMLFSITGGCWYYVLSRHKGIENKQEIDCYLVRRLVPPYESFITNLKKDYVEDPTSSFIFIGNYPAYNWEAFMKTGDDALVDATDLALKSAGSPVRKGNNYPVPPVMQVPQLPVLPVSKKPKAALTKITTGTIIKPKETPVIKKKVVGEDIDCHCGSYFIGVTQKGKGHSSWCPMFKE